MKKRININELVWLGILIAFSYFIYELLISGDMTYYIHPRMTIYAKFAFAVFVLLSLVQVRRLFSTSRRRFKLGYFIFIIPLFLGFAVEPQAVSADIVAKKGLNMVRYSEGESNTDQRLNMPSDESDEKTDDKSRKDALDVFDYRQMDVIEINDENFLMLHEDINNNIDRYKGKTIITYGFVYKDENHEVNEFLTARVVVVCCAADSLITGYLCEWDEAKSLEHESWVKIQGTIDSTLYKYESIDFEYEIPLILVDQVTSHPVPEMEYIFPEY